MISYKNIGEKVSFQETTILVSLIFSLGMLSLWTVIDGAVPALFFIFIFIFAFLCAFLYPRAGIMALIVNTVLFQRYFTQAPLIYHDTLIKLYPLDAILGGTLLYLIVSLLVSRGRSLWSLRCDGWLLLFFGYVTVLLFAALFDRGPSDGAIAFSTWKNYVFYGSLYLVIREIFFGEYGRKILGKTFLLSVAAALVFLVIGIVRGEGLWTEFTPLSTSGMRILDFPHALYFSIAFLGILLLSVTSRKIFARYQKFFTFVFPVLLLIGIVGSLMRHLWIALFFGVSMGFILLSSSAKARLLRSSATLLGIIAVIGIMGLALLTLAPQSRMAHQSLGALSSLAERVTSISDSGIDESVAWRYSVWQSAFGRLSESPLFGTGLGQNVPVELGDYHDFVVVRNIHNSWLALLVQTGLIGTMLFLLFLAGLVKELFRKRVHSDEEGGVRAAYGSILVFYSIVFLFQPYLESNILATFFWILLGLIGAFIRNDTAYENH